MHQASQPDSTGFYMDSHVACGFNRLAIDSDPLSDQPMLDASRRYLLLFNGEIYNHNKLRDELEARHQIKFATRSDTEVLLDGLIAEGADFIGKLDGIYAFAFVDLETLEVLLARDVFGVKPLYYFSRARSIVVQQRNQALAGHLRHRPQRCKYGPLPVVRHRRRQRCSNFRCPRTRFEHDRAVRDGQVIGSARNSRIRV